MRIKLLLALLTACTWTFTCVTPCKADHVPEKLIARGRAPRALAGVNIQSTKYRSFTIFGKRAQIVSEQPVQGCSSNCAGEEKIVVPGDGCTVHIFADYLSPGALHVVYAVEAASTPGSISAKCRTNTGATIGQPFSQLRRLHGDRYLVIRQLSSTDNEVALYEWRDGTKLEVEIDNTGTVRKLDLTRNIE